MGAPAAAPPAPMAPVVAPPLPAGPAPMQAAATIWGAVGWWGMYGLGARYMQPVGHSLLNLPNIRDQVAVEVGLDYLRESYGYLALGNYSWSEVLPVVGGMWQFWINPNLALYPKLDFGYAFGWFSGFTYCNGIPDCKEPTYGGFFFNVSAGAIYTIGKLALRVELGNELFKGGFAYAF